MDGGNTKETAYRKPLPKAAEPFKWKPGQSGNLSGRPKRDIAAEISLLAFATADQEKAAKLLQKMMFKNPKMFQVLSDRGFGKVPQTLNVSAELNVSMNVAERLKAARKRVEK